ncbi:rod-binding protein [Dongia sp.]|uniref:rod-binding protein n=1 Tax=Dongia sp. TaxID=1977262 RepID=UPI0035B1DEC0
MSDIGIPTQIDPSLIAGGNTAQRNQQPKNAAEIRAIAEDFEAFFAGLVFDEITAEMEPDPLTGGGQAEGMFRSLLNQEYGKSVARTGSLGIADIVQRQLLQLQETQ